MQEQNTSEETRCVSRCDETFIECVDKAQSGCLERFHRCESSCQR